MPETTKTHTSHPTQQHPKIPPTSRMRAHSRRDAADARWPCQCVAFVGRDRPHGIVRTDRVRGNRCRSRRARFTHTHSEQQQFGEQQQCGCARHQITVHSRAALVVPSRARAAKTLTQCPSARPMLVLPPHPPTFQPHNERYRVHRTESKTNRGTVVLWYANLHVHFVVGNL